MTVRSHLRRSVAIIVEVTLHLFLSLVETRVEAQVPPITPSGLNTHISGPITVDGKTHFDITGGTRADGGLNLFHSFGDFVVPSNNIANFLNDTGLPTSNILGRTPLNRAAREFYIWIWGTLRSSHTDHTTTEL